MKDFESFVPIIEKYLTTMASLGQILNDKIGKSGKSKAYVAGELGVSERTIENYMKGVRNPKPDAMVKLSKILKFDLSQLSEQNVPTKSTETPQNGHQDKPDELKQLLRLIQFKTGKTLEQIASDIEYARAYLTNEANKGNNPKLIEILKEKYKDFISDELQTATKTPVFEMKPTNGKDHTISLLVSNETKLIDTNKNQQETIGKLTDLVTKLVEKK